MNNQRSAQAAFSLVEVALALGVAAFALITIFGLLPVGLNSNQAAIRQTEAANILTILVSDLRSTATTATTSPRLSISLTATPASSPQIIYLDQTGSLAQTGGPYPTAFVPTSAAQYRAVISVAVPALQSPAPVPAVSPVPHQHVATNVGVVVSWPVSIALPSPSASPSPAVLPANVPNTVAAFVALDRN